jgi:hypothetical protein
LLIYGDRQASRDFQSFDQLIEVLRIAKLAVDLNALSGPTDGASSILLSQSLELSDAELSLLGLNAQ